MNNPFVRKLERGAELSAEDVALLERLSADPEPVAGGFDLIGEGDRPENVHLVMAGIACRYTILPDGGRQIMAYLVPGDLCDFHVAILGQMDHAIATLTPCQMVDLPRAVIDDLTDNHPRINRALWWSTLVDEAILRDWLVGMGRRDADAQLAHLFCELYARFETVGLAGPGPFVLPLTQEELGDTLGVSSVHINRVLTRLRREGLVVPGRGKITVPDIARLRAFADFDPSYLHLAKRTGDNGGEGRENAAPSEGDE
jgi:CRP-like cAMP-binding protein